MKRGSNGDRGNEQAPRQLRRHRSFARAIWFVAAPLGAVLLTACAGVEPWERDVLARPDMQLVADPTEAAVDDHIYFSKEASSGGQGFGGGGCGCN